MDDMNWKLIAIILAVIFLIALSFFLYSFMSSDGSIAQAFSKLFGAGKNYANI